MSGVEPLRRLAHAARVAWHWHNRSLVVPELPQIISIETTNRCNFACSYCPQSRADHFEDNEPGALTPDRAEVLLRRIRDAGVRSEMMSWTLDGEPFMNRRFDEIIERAQAIGFTTHHFASNGSLMSVARVRDLPRDCRYVILPDFCADEREFETLRGPRGSWRQVLDNLVGILEDARLAHVELHVGDIASIMRRDPSEVQARRQALVDLLPRSPRLTVYSVGQPHNAAGTIGGSFDAGPTYKLCPYPWTTMYISRGLGTWSRAVATSSVRRCSATSSRRRSSTSGTDRGPSVCAEICASSSLSVRRPAKAAACPGASPRSSRRATWPRPLGCG